MSETVPVTGDQPDLEPDRLWTIPNALSILRLFGVPLFLYLVLGPHENAWAVVVLAVSGFTDWLDGVLARALNQTSRLGALLDPLADRLYILATLVGLVLRHIMPLWLAIVIVGRDLVLGLTLPLLRRAGYGPPAVHYLGKAATFCLLYAFPLLLLGTYDNQTAYVAKAIAWGFTIWGSALYVWAGAVYFVQVTGLIRRPVATPART
ncbi:CDP-alcohol phosphatidyltransferase family protein [uncultured Jatrophihabitans sp.]|uniref:CDP-alcohol phosphatidyltransferase family protein n=1 Tax=uncultured Jatrophihabitans sp. TaxID=1610747 RepID=UPI0035C9BC92